MAEILTSCSGCGVAMAPNAVLYDRDAQPICDACFGKLDLLETDRRAAANIRKAGFTSLGAGVLALVAPMLYSLLVTLCLLAAITSGVFAIQSLARGNERFTKHLTPLQQKLVWVTSIGGIVLAAIAQIAMRSQIWRIMES